MKKENNSSIESAEKSSEKQTKSCNKSSIAQIRGNKSLLIPTPPAARESHSMKKAIKFIMFQFGWLQALRFGNNPKKKVWVRKRI